LQKVWDWAVDISTTVEMKNKLLLSTINEGNTVCQISLATENNIRTDIQPVQAVFSTEFRTFSCIEI
jgi:hypothetical protein